MTISAGDHFSFIIAAAEQSACHVAKSKARRQRIGGAEAQPYDWLVASAAGDSGHSGSGMAGASTLASSP